MEPNNVEIVSPQHAAIKNEIVGDELPICETDYAAESNCIDNVKCGEIFTLNNFDFLLICAYCGHSFSDLYEFGKHLRCYHPNFADNLCQEHIKKESRSRPVNTLRDGEEARVRVEKNVTEKRPNYRKVYKLSKPKFFCKCCNKPYRYRLSFQRHKCPAVEKYDSCKSEQFAGKMVDARQQLSTSSYECAQGSSADIKSRVGMNLMAEQCNKQAQEERFDSSCEELDDSAVPKDLSNRLGTDVRLQQSIDSQSALQRDPKIKDDASDFDYSDDEYDPRDTQNGASKGDSRGKQPGNPDLFCEVCYRQFKYKNVFRRHCMQHDEAPIALRNDPTYRKCIYCGLEFANNAEWFRHENEHPKTGPYRCSQCSKKFKTENELEFHLKSHSEQGPVTCDQCGLQFSQAKNLSSHINRVHLQLKPFPCELCDRKFVRKVELNVHMRRHTGERPYQCEECGRSFMISTLLNEHLKRHSNVRDIKCFVCPMAFFTKKMLRKHMVKHSTERPYVCPVCGNNFSRKKALLAHKKIHMEIKQYVCNLCGKAFAQHAGLYMHRKTHNNAVDL